MSAHFPLSYAEYPIRCSTCNEPIACLAEDYERLLDNGASIEDALNYLGIMAYCSRNAMMNPTYVPYNVQNRRVIEGKDSVERVDVIGNIFDPVQYDEKLTFNRPSPQQLEELIPLQTINPGNIVSHPVWTPPRLTSQQKIAPPAPAKPKRQYTVDYSRFIQEPVIAPSPQPLLSSFQAQSLEDIQRLTVKNYEELQNIKELYEFKELQMKPEEFIKPRIPGFPVFNQSSSEFVTIVVGNEYTGKPLLCEVINGRTYLAR